MTTNLVVFLGFDPNDEGQILPILEARLKDSIRICKENPGSMLLLMGSHTFRAKGPNIPDLALAMGKYIEGHAPDLLKTTKLILENKSTSTVEELCFLKDFSKRQGGDPQITVIASEFFADRVKLYAEYILGDAEGVNFIASAVPEEGKGEFEKIEEDKLAKAREWLSRHEKGNSKIILREQKAFEKKIISGEIIHPHIV